MFGDFGFVELSAEQKAAQELADARLAAFKRVDLIRELSDMLAQDAAPGEMFKAVVDSDVENSKAFLAEFSQILTPEQKLKVAEVSKMLDILPPEVSWQEIPAGGVSVIDNDSPDHLLPEFVGMLNAGENVEEICSFVTRQSSKVSKPKEFRKKLFTDAKEFLTEEQQEVLGEVVNKFNKKKPKNKVDLGYVREKALYISGLIENGASDEDVIKVLGKLKKGKGLKVLDLASRSAYESNNIALFGRIEDISTTVFPNKETNYWADYEEPDYVADNKKIKQGPQVVPKFVPIREDILCDDLEYPLPTETALEAVIERILVSMTSANENLDKLDKDVAKIITDNITDSDDRVDFIKKLSRRVDGIQEEFEEYTDDELDVIDGFFDKVKKAGGVNNWLKAVGDAGKLVVIIAAPDARGEEGAELRRAIALSLGEGSPPGSPVQNSQAIRGVKRSADDAVEQGSKRGRGGESEAGAAAAFSSSGSWVGDLAVDRSRSQGRGATPPL